MTVKSIVTNEKKLALLSIYVDSYSEVLGIASDLVDTANFYSQQPVGCVGLACNQIGILKRIIIIRFAGDWLVMINPVIEEAWAGRFNAKEGCLSLPGKSVSMRRYKKIRVTYTVVSGDWIDKKFTKFTARIIQHEVDHLNGKYI